MTGQFFIAIGGGIIPALLWLLFWIREDRKHPEPIRLLVLTFFAGMVSVLIALKLEMIVFDHVNGEIARLVWWAIIEELAKFGVAFLVILRRKEVDEPIDLIVYMIAVALGFAALENVFFLLNPDTGGDSIQALMTGNLRFIGATLLHVAASAAIGITMALSFFKGRFQKHLYLASGLLIATALHAAFNVAIIVGDGHNSLLASSIVWVVVIGILLLFEKVKKLHPSLR